MAPTRASAAVVVVLLLLGVMALCACAPTSEETEAGATTEGASTGAAPDGGVTESAGAAPVINPLEEPCLRAGGLCLRASECPAGQLSQTRGLCPAQRDQGVDCCHGLSILERRCSARGGVCRPKQKCGRSLWEDKAEDCASDETCCILVT